MYMNRFIVGLIVGLGLGASLGWYLLASDKEKRCVCKKGKQWAKRVSNIY